MLMEFATIEPFIRFFSLDLMKNLTKATFNRENLVRNRIKASFLREILMFLITKFNYTYHNLFLFYIDQIQLQ